MPCAARAWHDRRVPHRRLVTVALPTEISTRDGLAYTLWLPVRRDLIRGGVTILHGAGSCKESHHDFARAARGAGFGVVAFDQRGHGESLGPMDGGVLDDIASMTAYLRSSIGDAGAPIALRGSSMGGFLALLAAERCAVSAVVAICPASSAGLRRGLQSGSLHFDVNVPAFDALLAASNLEATVAALEVPVLLLHAEGDETVPVQHSRELAVHLRSPRSRLITVPGGHHRSIQHDEELQAVSLRFLDRVMRPSADVRRPRF
jgi:uncharacterized protein